MAWCEAHGVDFLFGLAKNERLIAEIETELDVVAAKSRRTGHTERRFKSFMWIGGFALTNSASASNAHMSGTAPAHGTEACLIKATVSAIFARPAASCAIDGAVGRRSSARTIISLCQEMVVPILIMGLSSTILE
jgi:hypothetical protein